jgi:hypothetical protein
VRIAGCNFQMIDEQGNVTGEFREPLSVVRTGRELLRSWVYGCGLMIHRAALIEAGLFNESNRTTQDLEMWLRLIERDPIYLLPEVLAQFRQHAEAGSRTESRYQRDKDELFARILDRYPPTFFDPAATTPHQRAVTYWFLAGNAMGREAWGGARLAIDRAWREERSMRNPAFKAHILGPRMFSRWWRTRSYVEGRLRSAARRILPAWFVARWRARRR